MVHNSTTTEAMRIARIPDAAARLANLQHLRWHRPELFGAVRRLLVQWGLVPEDDNAALRPRHP